jgi:hypothetical protein
MGVYIYVFVRASALLEKSNVIWGDKLDPVLTFIWYRVRLYMQTSNIIDACGKDVVARYSKLCSVVSCPLAFLAVPRYLTTSQLLEMGQIIQTVTVCVRA